MTPTPTAAPAEDRAWLLAQAEKERAAAAEYNVMLNGYLRADWPEKAREVEQCAADHLALAARYDRLAGVCEERTGGAQVTAAMVERACEAVCPASTGHPWSFYVEHVPSNAQTLRDNVRIALTAAFPNPEDSAGRVRAGAGAEGR